MPYPPSPQPPIAAQADALRALLHLIDLHPHLPGAYVVSHNLFPNQVDIQLDSPGVWETWRETLNLATESATHRASDTREFLECATTIGGTAIRIYSVFPRVDTSIRTSRFPFIKSGTEVV
ncbi:hypothetical protein RVR_6104 [Actinacidiphila reveromycinica]|uniref:Uncharacterized protein n=1 Tax=Actinacidiphila reveromycinica TaxID=659352 RepID=A0A7U3UVN6_9ACTN|nr:hypothetical protein [Streptomyces sp. SN-593]BBA99471.1 hypothetical protein RVR_6104 [Streptomyces sp. SN-593]